MLGDEHAREFALKSIDRVISENMCGESMCHYSDGERRLSGVLSDQVHFADALIDAYQSTGVRRYLDEAEKLVEFMISQLPDVIDGGFYFKPFEPSARAEALERHKPFDENVAAASLLTRIGHLTGNNEYSSLAERTLRAISYPQVKESIVGMGYGLAVDMFITSPLHIVLVGGKNDVETKRMLETSLHAYEPEKLVQLLDPEEGPLTVGDLTYEASDKPLAYVCVQNVCRPPVEGVDDLVALLDDILKEED